MNNYIVLALLIGIAVLGIVFAVVTYMRKARRQDQRLRRRGMHVRICPRQRGTCGESS